MLSKLCKNSQSAVWNWQSGNACLVASGLVLDILDRRSDWSVEARDLYLSSGQRLAGIEFGDNNAQNFITEDNGFASIRFRVSQQLTFCTWLYPRWTRWNVM